ncbi:MAG: hypothetical protein AAFN10_28845, partial [Bacteroidota bacterium]
MRIGLILGFLLLMTLILPRSFRLNLQHKGGQIWPHEDLSAPYDFFVLKAADTLVAEQALAAAQVADIYMLDTSRVRQSQDQIVLNIKSLSKRLQQYRQALSQGDSLNSKRHIRQFFQPEYGDFSLDQFPAINDYEAWSSQLIVDAFRVAN